MRCTAVFSVPFEPKTISLGKRVIVLKSVLEKKFKKAQNHFNLAFEYCTIFPFDEGARKRTKTLTTFCHGIYGP
jgi:hypothetical protein